MGPEWLENKISSDHFNIIPTASMLLHSVVLATLMFSHHFSSPLSLADDNHNKINNLH